MTKALVKAVSLQLGNAEYSQAIESGKALSLAEYSRTERVANIPCAMMEIHLPLQCLGLCPGAQSHHLEGVD